MPRPCEVTSCLQEPEASQSVASRFRGAFLVQMKRPSDDSSDTLILRFARPRFYQAGDQAVCRPGLDTGIWEVDMLVDQLSSSAALAEPVFTAMRIPVCVGRLGESK
jgi:hypothetical protein